jgi:hypothetical protein
MTDTATSAAPDTPRRVRLTPDQRRAVILDAAVRLTKDRGSVLAWTCGDVADACSVPTNFETVKEYYTMEQLRQAVSAAM